MDADRETALEFAMDLRAAGRVVETDLAGRSVGGQFGYADEINADTVIVVGQNDLDDGVVTVRDMDSGDEELIDVDSVVGSIVE